MLSFGNTLSKTCVKAARKALSSMCWMWLFAKTLISFLYACFSGAKQPTSSGCRMCDECEGIQRVMILLSSQRSWKASDLWLSWPSRINSRWLPTVLASVCWTKCCNQARPSSFVVQPLTLTPILQSLGLWYQAWSWCYALKIKKGGTT